MTTRRDPDADDAPPAPLPEDPGEGLRFVHLLEAQTKARVAELSASFNALVETLVGEGHLPLDLYEKRRRLTVIRENQRAAEEASIAIGEAPDKYALTELPEIDCAARLQLCQARCCTLPFVLSAQDLDERVVRWDYAAPYRIARRREDGYCVHNEHGSCAIHDARPASCRVYDCRRDRRIWLDFERRVPAP